MKNIKIFLFISVLVFSIGIFSKVQAVDDTATVNITCNDGPAGYTRFAGEGQSANLESGSKDIVIGCLGKFSPSVNTTSTRVKCDLGEPPLSATDPFPGAVKACFYKISNPSSYDLTVTKEGSGSVVSNPEAPGINCGTDCTESYTANTYIELTATPDAGFSFGGWKESCTNATGKCSLTMNSAKSVKAIFKPILTVTKNGTGAGAVTSAPAGINCGTECKASYTLDTSVVLTATASAGSTFTGWTGACKNSTGTCTVSMDQARSVNATFNLPNSNATLNNPVSSNVACNSVTLGATITSVGSPNAYSERGICYRAGDQASRTDGLSTCVAVSGTGTGDFSANISGLSVSTSYNFIGYAGVLGYGGIITNVGTTSQGTFTTPACDTNKPNLIVSSLTPTTATQNVEQTFTATISNTGNVSTGSGFSNIFQTATSIADPNNPTGLKIYQVELTNPIDTKKTADIQQKITFATSGYIRACADNKNPMTLTGDIAESKEDDNCNSNWVTVTVGNNATDSLDAKGCTIQAGASTCLATINSWSVGSPVSGASTAITTNYPADNTTVTGTTTTSGTNKTHTIPYGDRTFYLYHNNVSLTSVKVTATCASGSEWINGVCATINANTKLTISKSSVNGGTGVVRTSDGKIDCGPTCFSNYVNGSLVTIEASPNAGSVFSGFTYDGSTTFNNIINSLPLTKDITVNAIFSGNNTSENCGPGPYTLTVKKDPSDHSCSVTLDGGSKYGRLYCNNDYPLRAYATNDIIYFDAGTIHNIVLETTNDFSKWEGDYCSTVFAGGFGCEFKMDCNKTVTAKFGSTPPPDTNPTISNFTITPPLIIIGQSVKATWSSTGASSCLINASDGTKLTPPNPSTSSTGFSWSPTKTNSYTLVCTNSSGTSVSSAPVKVTVIDPNYKEN